MQTLERSSVPTGYLCDVKNLIFVLLNQLKIAHIVRILMAKLKCGCVSADRSVQLTLSARWHPKKNAKICM